MAKKVGTSAGVSVVIPAFNSARFLPQVLEAAFSQTYPPLEVILVDDGSTDETPQVMQHFQNRVTYIRREHKGPSSALNRGILRARGEWIAFLDADDLWLPHRLEHELAFAERTRADLVFSDLVEVLPTRTVPSYLEDHRQKAPLAAVVRDGVLPNPVQLLLERGCFILPSTVLVRRKRLLEAGLFDENLRGPEDIDLWIRLAPISCFAFTPEPLVVRRVHGRNLSWGGLEFITERIKMLEKAERLEMVRKQRDCRQPLRRKKARLYWEQGYHFFERNQPAAARVSWTRSLRSKFSHWVALYWAVTLLPGPWVISLRGMIQRIKRRRRAK